MPKVFESPDGGQTVYERDVGSQYRRLVKEPKSKMDRILEDKMWGDIRRMGQTNPAMQEQLERVIMLYHLLKENK